MTMRAMEPGWVKIGATCSAGRRSMWWRVTYEGVEDPNSMYSRRPILIELCAGREGDDEYLQIDRTNPAFDGLMDVFSSAEFAAET